MATPPAIPSVPAPHAIDAQGLGVKYNLRFTKKTTIRQSFPARLKRESKEKEFWALRDVTFRIVHGESLGVIGPNGAGKSTLLQVLAGIILPSAGAVDVRGQVSSLLTLGAGFDLELTGRENILLAGAFLGIDSTEMRRRVDSIIQYADIGDFIDAPIKTYSSGMRARLGFAIATSVDPDILLLDEVLATGDATFRAKSKVRVLELVQAAKAIVLVTHDMNWVTEYCNRAILLERGRIVAMGSPDEVVEIHRDRSAQRRAEAQEAGVFKEVRERSAKAARRRRRRAGGGGLAELPPVARLAGRLDERDDHAEHGPRGQRAPPVEHRAHLTLHPGRDQHQHGRWAREPHLVRDDRPRDRLFHHDLTGHDGAGEALAHADLALQRRPRSTPTLTRSAFAAPTPPHWEQPRWRSARRCRRA